jgi:hypothetical protein
MTGQLVHAILAAVIIALLLAICLYFGSDPDRRGRLKKDFRGRFRPVWWWASGVGLTMPIGAAGLNAMTRRKGEITARMNERARLAYPGRAEAPSSAEPPG